MKTLLDDRFWLGSGHVQRGVRQVWWSLNSNSQICSLNMSGLRPDKSEKHLWNPIKGPDKSGGPNLLWIGLTGLTGVQYWSER
jgi:hypothetical protein